LVNEKAIGSRYTEKKNSDDSEKVDRRGLASAVWRQVARE
jgi:hypothetical protein